MASLSRLIKEKGGETGGIRTGQVKVQQIHYTKLRESGLNFYTRSREEVAELADSMLIAGGILQPLIVRKTDMSEYEILAGHKRRRASIYNVERGYKEYEFPPCIVVDMGGLMAEKISEKILAGQGGAGDDRLLDMIAEYIVICTNSTSSESSSYEKMMQAARLSEILPAMLENGELKGRALRAEIAKEMKCGDGQVGRYQSIYNNLVPEAMERFKDGRITISVAYGLSGLDSDRQQLALKKEQVTMADIDVLKQEKCRETVSESDTGKVCGTEFTEQEDNGGMVSELDTGKAPSEISHTCTENNPATPGNGAYSPMEDTEDNIQYALEFIFDRDDSGFPQDIMQELLNTADSTGNVALMVDIMEKALPFENEHIKFEQACGYSIYFKQDKRKMRLALWPFWRGFRERYHYSRIDRHDELQAADEEQDDINDGVGSSQENALAAVMDEGTKETAASEEAENAQAVGYTLEDVRNVYGEYIMKSKVFKDEQINKKDRIIKDGLECLMTAFKEGTIC